MGSSSDWTPRDPLRTTYREAPLTLVVHRRGWLSGSQSEVRDRFEALIGRLADWEVDRKGERPL